MDSVAIKLPGCRTDAATFFSLSGYYIKGARWPQRPLLVFVVDDDGFEVQILDSASQLARSTLPDSTPCMQQWAGQWRSDFFTFTLGEARAALAGLRD
jgi:hypothetical protein